MQNNDKDIFEGVELEGLSQEELDSMTNDELKEFQMNQADEEIDRYTHQKKSHMLAFLIFSFILILGFEQLNYITSIVLSIITPLSLILYKRSSVSLKVAYMSKYALIQLHKDIE